MELPRNNLKLDDIFKSAAIPDGLELEGEYFVDMLTMITSLRRFSHRKVFYKENGRVLGHNLLLRNLKWGSFFLEEGACGEEGSLKALVINYGRKENSFVSNKIRDHVRCVEKGRLYLGRFNYLIMGKLCFLGYFSLSKE